MKNSSYLPVAQGSRWLAALVVLALVLVGCRADGDTADTTNTDTSVVVVPGADSSGTLSANQLVNGGENDEVEEINRVPLENADQLLVDLDNLPSVLLLQARLFGQPDIWALVSNPEPGQRLFVSPFTQIGYRIAQRDGFDTLNPPRINAINNSVRDALAPGVNSLLVNIRDLRVPLEENSLGNNQTDLYTLYTLVLNSMTVLPGEDSSATPGFMLPSDTERAAVAMADLTRDGGSGVFDGRGAGGEPVTGLTYNPLRFVPRYITSLQGASFQFASTQLLETVDDVDARRFINRDLRCDSSFVDSYFSANAGDLILEATRIEGYEDFFREGEDYAFMIEENGDLALLADNDELITLGSGDLFTCSSGTGSAVSLVRYVADISNDGELEELVIVGTGDNPLAGAGSGGGIYLASESSGRLAVLGNVNPFGGWNEPTPEQPDPGPTPDPDPVAASCGVDGLFSFSRNGDGTVASSDSSLTGTVSNADFAIDGDLTTAAALRLFVGGALSFAELTVSNDSPPMSPEDAGQVALVVSVPESLLQLGLFESLTVTTFRDGETLTSNGDLAFLQLDLLNQLGFDGQRVITMPADNEPFDAVSVELRGGLLNLDAQLQVFDICYGP